MVLVVNSIKCILFIYLKRNGYSVKNVTYKSSDNGTEAHNTLNECRSAARLYFGANTSMNFTNDRMLYFSCDIKLVEVNVNRFLLIRVPSN